jgi:hypothetical protein
MRHVLGVLGAASFFALNGVLWVMRPDGVFWLVAASVLGIAFFSGMLWYVTQE